MKILLLSTLLLGGTAWAKADVTPPPPPVTDPALVAIHYRQVLSQPPFQEPAEPDVNDRMKNWLSEWFTRLGAKLQQFRYAEEMPRFASLVTALMVALTLIGLILLAFRILRRRTGRDDKAKPESVAATILRPPEFYGEEMRRAAAAGDWHAAWMASWRQFLSRLEKDKLVAADRSRTNREYLAQLRTQPRSEPALALLDGVVDAYDRFIYGRRAIAEPDWRSFQERLEEAGLLLHLAGAPVPANLRPA